MKRNIRRPLFILACLLPALLGMGGYPSKYSAEAIEARAIDAETKQPLEGVIVTANWELEEGTLGGNVPVGQLMVMEAVTDKNGRFYFLAWGSKKPPKGGLRNKDPQLLLFKPGYHYRRLVNEFRDHMYEEPVRRSEWNGKTVELKPFKGTAEEYAEHVYKLDGNFDRMRDGEDCEWKKIPQMLVALHRMREDFDSRGIKTPGWQIGARIRKVTDVGNQRQCGSVEDIFRSYLP